MYYMLGTVLGTVKTNILKEMHPVQEIMLYKILNVLIVKYKEV